MQLMTTLPCFSMNSSHISTSLYEFYHWIHSSWISSHYLLFKESGKLTKIATISSDSCNVSHFSRLCFASSYPCPINSSLSSEASCSHGVSVSSSRREASYLMRGSTYHVGCSYCNTYQVCLSLTSSFLCLLYTLLSYSPAVCPSTPDWTCYS